ncbi:MAG TPA: hypothetical protein VEJ87_09455, partial [Acidimicrobiales bacterium]|nr:hypothetical protein [Acidimicrobiales bacterium]
MEAMEGNGNVNGNLRLEVDVGRRVIVMSNLLLGPHATLSSTWAETGIARALDAWEGPGLVVIAGNLFDLTAATADPVKGVERAVANHPRLFDALSSFACGEDRRMVCLPGRKDHQLGDSPPTRRGLEQLGIEVATSADLDLTSASGVRRVRIESSSTSEVHAAVGNPLKPDPTAPWQEGVDRLSEPSEVQRFLTSRLLYRRFARFTWWLLVPFALVIIVRIPFTDAVLDHLFGNQHLPARAIDRAASASWTSRLLVAAGISVIGLAVLAAVLGVISRKAWVAMGGGKLASPLDDAMEFPGATTNDAARDRARSLQEEGYSGLVTGATLQAELTHLASGFFASAGVCGEVVEEHPGRFGLPPVFIGHRQLAWIELETGAELHARLLLARNDVAPQSLLERLAARYRPVHDSHPVVVAAAPSGASWPPAPDLSAVRRRSRRARRWGAAAIAVTGAVDLLSAVTPPLRERLHLVLQVLPLGATQLAGALVALAGIGLLVLARGVRRGQ